MRATDAMLAVPRLPLLMIAASVLQPSIPLLVLMIGFAGWMETARLVRAEFRTLRARDFVESARASGAGHVRLIAAHLLPNAAQAVTVSLTLAVARGIPLESALSFFGVGVQPPNASCLQCYTRLRQGVVEVRWLSPKGIRRAIQHRSRRTWERRLL
jgi:peptide/nickel transport system permease protein